MRATVTFLVVTLPFAALWSTGCAAVGAGIHALARRIGRKPLRVKMFLFGDSEAAIERSKALIASVRERREANDARLAALDEVVGELAASNWPSVGSTAEERIESIRRRVDEKLAKSGAPFMMFRDPDDSNKLKVRGPGGKVTTLAGDDHPSGAPFMMFRDPDDSNKLKVRGPGGKVTTLAGDDHPSVGPVPIDPGVAGPTVGPVPIDPGEKAQRTWADVRRDQLEVAEEVNAMVKPEGWEKMSADDRTSWKIREERVRLDAREAARLAK